MVLYLSIKEEGGKVEKVPDWSFVHIRVKNASLMARNKTFFQLGKNISEEIFNET